MPFRLALAVLVAATAALLAQAPESDAYVIRNVRVFDGMTVAERQTVVISQGRVAAVGSSVTIPAGAQEVAGRSARCCPA